MKLTVLCMGKTRERFIRDGMEKFVRFLGHYADLEVRELKEEKIQDLKEAPRIRKREAERIGKAIAAGAFTVSLDERGEEFTSHEFAAFLNGVRESGVREIVFILGGALGLDERVTTGSNRTVSLSRLTFTHEMARLVLLEQLYRAFTIVTGKTYHY
ncbi:MAG TPA: 23S rRNA (pseudouridine(1915)-N(3))-methyltransferase RlmH [Nitrospirota bacterium]|nr:23S rRNA (pseudouridine(1915)-N(3))-methyltransferase RlmH [Nitrospirota bacterium]